MKVQQLKGSGAKLVGKFIMSILGFWILYFLIEQALIEFGDMKYIQLTQIGCILGGLLSIILAIVHKTLLIQLTPDHLVIQELGKGERRYAFKEVQFLPDVYQFNLSGVPVFTKIRLHVGDFAGNKIGKLNLAGLSVKDANILFNQLIHQVEETQQGENTAFAEHKKTFEAKEFPLNIDTKAAHSGARDVTLILGLFLLAIAVLGALQGGEDGEVMLFSGGLLGGLLLFLALILTIRKNPKGFPTKVAVTEKALIIDGESYQFNELDRIYYTPDSVENVYRTITIFTTNKQKIVYRLGIQRDASAFEKAKFAQYPEFITLLTECLADQPNKVMADITLEHVEKLPR